MGRPKGSKDLKPRKKRIDKPNQKVTTKFHTIKKDKYLDLTKELKRQNRSKYLNYKYRYRYLNDFNEWINNIITVGFATAILFITILLIGFMYF